VILNLVINVLLRNIHIFEKILVLRVSPRETRGITSCAGGCVAAYGAPLHSTPAYSVSVHQVGCQQEDAWLDWVIQGAMTMVTVHRVFIYNTKILAWKKSVLRIRIGSGFNAVPGSGPQRTKMSHKYSFFL
jgi:hypothetical protein